MPKSPVQNDETIRNDLVVQSDGTVRIEHCHTTCPPTPPLNCWSSRRANSPIAKSPLPTWKHSALFAVLRRCSALGDCVSSLCSSPSVLAPFSYSALVSTVSPCPRLDSTLDCVTVPYIIDCVTLLYHFLLLFSFSVSYCTLYIVWLILNSRN